MWHLWVTLLISQKVEITGLYRHPVKGMSADALERVVIQNKGETFPDDRRYALLFTHNTQTWDEKDPDWLHKENFLCAFTAPQLFAQYMNSYQILSNDSSQSYGLPCDEFHEDVDACKRLLTVKKRSSEEVVLGPVDLSTVDGRQKLATFFSEQSGKEVVCVTAASDTHKHQFGNTFSGVKARGDTRTVHIVNAATVRELSMTLQRPVTPTRFRPNIVIDGLEPWEEFNWINKSIMCGNVKLSVIARTVRCEGVSIDPLCTLDDPDRVLDIPRLLAKHYPQYGPYFGVYAVIEEPGSISLGDKVKLID